MRNDAVDGRLSELLAAVRAEQSCSELRLRGCVNDSCSTVFAVQRQDCRSEIDQFLGLLANLAASAFQNVAAILADTENYVEIIC